MDSIYSKMLRIIFVLIWKTPADKPQLKYKSKSVYKISNNIYKEQELIWRESDRLLQLFYEYLIICCFKRFSSMLFHILFIIPSANYNQIFYMRISCMGWLMKFLQWGALIDPEKCLPWGPLWLLSPMGDFCLMISFAISARNLFIYQWRCRPLAFSGSV